MKNARWLQTMIVLVFCLCGSMGIARADQDSVSAEMTLDTRDYTLTVNSDHGAPSPAVGSHADYCWKSKVTCTVQSEAEEDGVRYSSSGWSGSGSVPAGGTSTSTGELTLTEQNSVITWNWNTSEYYLDTEVSGQGSVDISDSWYSAGKSVTIKASAAAGHHFTAWSGDTHDSTINDTQITIPMDQARTISAAFAKDPKPQITGIEDDLTPKQSKTWSWGADQEATFRYAVNQSKTWTPSGEYSSVTTATQSGADGTWYLHVQAKSSDGLVSEVWTVSAVLDNTAPAISGLADDDTVQQSKTWTWSANEDASYRFAIDQKQAWTPEGAYQDGSSAQKSGTDGTWYLHVQARDTAGNVSGVQTVSALLDNTAPVLSGLADDPNPVKAKTWTWSASEDCTYRYAIDQNQAWTPSGDFQAVHNATQAGVDGTWYVHVQARDQAGNLSPVETVSALLDNTPPSVSMDPAAGSFSTCDPVQVSFQATEPGQIYYTKDGSEPGLSSMSGASLLVAVSRSIKARAVDQAGNMGPVALAEFVIDCPDSDGDGINNDLDLDDDNDGLSDIEEDLLGTSRATADTDGDGLLDPDDPDPLQDNFSAEPELVKANTSEDDPELIAVGTLYQDYWSYDGGDCYYELNITEPGNYNLLVRPVGTPSEDPDQKGQGRMLCTLSQKSDSGDLTYLRQTSLDADEPQHLRLPLLQGTYLLQVSGKSMYNTTFQLIAVQSSRLYDLSLFTDADGRAVQPLVIAEKGQYRLFLRLNNSTLGNETANNCFNATLYAGKQGGNAAQTSVIKQMGPAGEIYPSLNLKPGWITLQLEAAAGKEVRCWMQKQGQVLSSEEREPNQALSSADSFITQEEVPPGTEVLRKAGLGGGLDIDTLTLLAGSEDDQTEHSLYIDIAIDPETWPQGAVLSLKLLQSSGHVLKSLTFTGESLSGQLANIVDTGLYFLQFGSLKQEPLSQEVRYSLRVKDTSGSMAQQPEDQQAQQLLKTDYLGLLQMIMYLQEWQENQTEIEDNLGSAVIVNGVGDAPDNALHPAARALSDYAYKVLYDRGLGHDAICFMSADSYSDWNGDGQNDDVADVSELTVPALEQAITQWAVQQKSKGPFYVYLVDHGGNQAFQLSQTNQAVLSAGELDQMLDTFQDETKRAVVLIMEACYSGSFEAELTGEGRPDRAVLFSSKAFEQSYIESGGAASFSRFVLKKLGQGHQLQHAFQHAKQTIGSDAFAGIMQQTPQASFMDLGGQYLGTGYLTAGQDWVAAPMSSKFVSATGSAGLFVDPAEEASIPLSAHVYSVTGLKRVWATVLPPDYEPPQVGEDFETPDLSPYTVDLVYNAQSNRYEGSYVLPEGAVAGEYDLTYFLEDVEGTLASSKDMGGSLQSGTLGFGPGWNLAGLWLEPEDVAWEAVLGEALEDLTSVWAWGDGNWEVALPSMTGEAEAEYLEAKGFKGLSELSCGRGFWVNAANATSVQLSGTLPQDTELTLGPGWSLLGVKGLEALDAASLQQDTSIVSVWKWSQGNWCVCLPGHEDNGTGYAEDKGFGVLDTIEPGEGFWVNTE